MWLITFTLFLGILAVNADPFCPSGCPCKASCRSIWDTNQIKNCPVDSEYRCVDLPGCERYREYCFCIGNEKYEKSTDTCVGINECDVAELTDICTNDRPTGPGYCGDNDACTLSNISCSTVSQPICGEAICQDLPEGHECYCIGNLILTETPNGITCEKRVCEDCQVLGRDNLCYRNSCCDNNICMGNGKCEVTYPLRDSPKYDCICGRGFSGEHCENRICESEVDTFLHFKVEWAEGSADETSNMKCEVINQMFIGMATRKCARNSVWDKPDYTQCIRPIFSNLQQASLRNENIIGLQNSINDVTTEGASNNSFLFPGELILVNDALETVIDKYVDIQDGSRTVSEEENTATVETPEIAVRAGSYVLSGVNRESWELLGNITTLVGLVDSFERFSLSINNSISTFSSENLELEYERVDRSSKIELSSERGNDTSMKVVIGEDLVKLLNQYCNQTFFSSVRFRTIRELTPVVHLQGPHADTESTASLISDVYSLNTKQCINTTFVVPEESIKIEFTFLTNNSEARYTCGFWNLTTNSWSTEGVKTTIQQQDDGSVKITCTPIHLTSFAILLSSYTPTETDNTIQTILSVVTCSLSVVSLVVSLLCYLILFLRTRKSAKNPFKPDSIFIIHINFCMALLLATLTFLISPFATWDRIPCTVIAGLQHYLWLSVFSWSLCEGIAIAWKIRFWDRSQVLWPALIPLGWGLPIPIVVITIPVTYSYYVDLSVGCWVNSANNLKLISFILPILMTIPTNVLFYCYTLVTIYRLKEKVEDSKKQIRSIIIGSLVLLPLLGIPWVIGVFYVSKETAIFGYIFIILVGCQGVFFFIAHVARNSMIQDYVFKWKNLYGEHVQTNNKFVKLQSFQTSVQRRSYEDNGEATSNN